MLKNMEKMTENFCLTVLVLQQCFQKHFQTFSCVSPYGQDKLLDLVSEIWIENPKSRIQEQSVLLNHFWHYILRFCCRFSSVQSLSHVRLFATPWIAARQASLSITNYQSLLKLMSIESVMPSNHLILCRPLLLPSIFPSIRVFSNESALCIKWPKYWSFSFSISPSNEHPGLISFRMDWLNLLIVHRTRKSLLQHPSSKASVLRCSAFFIVWLSHPYMTTGKNIALTRLSTW